MVATTHDDEDSEESVKAVGRKKPKPLTDEEIDVFRSMVAERIFYKRLWKFLGYWSAYVSGAIVATWALRDFISAFWRALAVGMK